MTFEKKAVRISSLTEVFEFFSRARDCEAANLAKMSRESNLFPAALALNLSRSKPAHAFVHNLVDGPFCVMVWG